MKTLLALLIIAAAGALVGWRVAQLSRPAPPPAAPPLRPRASAELPAGAAPRARALAAGAEAGDAAAADAGSRALAACVDLLGSAKTSYAERWKLWDQLRQSGRLAEAVAALKGLQADNPGEAAIPLAIAEGEINQLRVLSQNHAPFDEISIMALQADKDFDAALALSPTDWDAEYEKAESLSYWPDYLGKGPEVVERLNSLISQQATLAPRPEFARSYALLGQQFQNAGQNDRAIQTWQQGLTAFPLDSNLQQRLAHASAP
jgi:tetratricopeptide (TPR) repeat protein